MRTILVVRREPVSMLCFVAIVRCIVTAIVCKGSVRLDTDTIDDIRSIRYQRIQREVSMRVETSSTWYRLSMPIRSESIPN